LLDNEAVNVDEFFVGPISRTEVEALVEEEWP
jgi:hypothetical protein